MTYPKSLPAADALPFDGHERAAVKFIFLTTRKARR